MGEEAGKSQAMGHRKQRHLHRTSGQEVQSSWWRGGVQAEQGQRSRGDICNEKQNAPTRVLKILFAAATLIPRELSDYKSNLTPKLARKYLAFIIIFAPA